MRNFIVIILVFLSVFNYAFSQVSGSEDYEKKYSGITVGFGLGMFSSMGSMKDDYNPGFTYGINGDYRLDKNITAGIGFLYSTMIGSDQNQPKHAVDLYYINPNIKYRFWLSEEKTSFYLQAGPGFYGTCSYNYSEFISNTEYRYYYGNKIKPGFHMGAGFDIYLGKIVSLNLNSLIHNYYDTDNKSRPMQFIDVQAGLKFRIM